MTEITGSSAYNLSESNINSFYSIKRTGPVVTKTYVFYAEPETIMSYKDNAPGDNAISNVATATTGAGTTDVVLGVTSTAGFKSDGWVTITAPGGASTTHEYASLTAPNTINLAAPGATWVINSMVYQSDDLGNPIPPEGTTGTANGRSVFNFTDANGKIVGIGEDEAISSMWVIAEDIQGNFCPFEIAGTGPGGSVQAYGIKEDIVPSIEAAALDPTDTGAPLAFLDNKGATNVTIAISLGPLASTIKQNPWPPVSGAIGQPGIPDLQLLGTTNGEPIPLAQLDYVAGYGASADWFSKYTYGLSFLGPPAVPSLVANTPDSLSPDGGELPPRIVRPILLGPQAQTKTSSGQSGTSINLFNTNYAFRSELYGKGLYEPEAVFVEPDGTTNPSTNDNLEASQTPYVTTSVSGVLPLSNPETGSQGQSWNLTKSTVVSNPGQYLCGWIQVLSNTPDTGDVSHFYDINTLGGDLKVSSGCLKLVVETQQLSLNLLTYPS